HGLLLRRWAWPPSIKVTACRCRAGRLGGLGGNSSLEGADPADQLSRGALGFDDLAFQLAAPLGIAGLTAGLPLEAGDQIAQVVLDRLDLVLEARERTLDLFDGPVRRHHPLHHVHAANDVGRIEPAGSAVLPLASHPHRAREQPQLHVLAERRLREANSTRLEDVDDLARGEAVRPGPLDLLDLSLVEEPPACGGFRWKRSLHYPIFKVIY